MRGVYWAVALALATGAPADEPRFQQDRFVIGSFVDPPIDERADEYYRDMADAGFNLVIGGFGASTPEQETRQRELCRELDLKLLTSPMGRPDETLPEGDEVWGYFLRDEPSAKDFPYLAERVASLRRHRPGRLGYINLFPSYCELERLGTASYDEHVRRFVDEVRPEVLCMDHYPFMAPEHDTREAYCTDLETMRQHSLRAGIPFWNFFNTMPFGPHGDPTEAQVRWQAFASVAHGAKGVLYFCYWTPRGAEFPKGGAILTAEGRKTHHFGHAQRTNAVLRAWGPQLMLARGEGAYRLRGGAEEHTPEKVPLRLSEGDFLAGLLSREDGRRILLLLNHDIAYSTWPTVTAHPEKMQEICRDTGKIIDPLDDSPDMEGLQLGMQPGDARLFIWGGDEE